MPQSNALSSYADVQALMSRAIGSSSGVRIRVGSKGEAVKLRQRAYKFRQSDREDSQKMYPSDDPHFNTSDYDCLSIMLREEAAGWFVYFEKFNPERLATMIEDL